MGGASIVKIVDRDLGYRVPPQHCNDINSDKQKEYTVER